MGVTGPLGLVVVWDGVDRLSELAGVVGGNAENEGVSCHNQLSIPGIPNRPISQSDGKRDVVLRLVELETGRRGCLKDTRGNGAVILRLMNSYLGSESLRCVNGVPSSVT